MALALLVASAGPVGAGEGLASVRVRSGPAGILRETLVRGEGALRFVGLLQSGSGADRSRLGLAFPAPGGRLHAGALRGVRAGTAGSASLLRPPWPRPPSLSVAGSEEGLAWVGPASGAAWARRGSEGSVASAWLSGPGFRVAGRTGPDPAARLDVRGPRGGRLFLRADRGGPVGLLAFGAPRAVLALAYSGGWDARIGLCGPRGGGTWRVEASVGAERTARSDLRAEWVRHRGGGELRFAARVNRRGAVVRSSGRLGLEVRITRGAIASVAARRELTAGREVSAGLDLRRRASSVRARLLLPERRGRRLDLQCALGTGRLRGRLRLRLEARRRPEVEVALTRRFALTSSEVRDRMRGIAEARD